ncbi:hypothetical protein ACTU3I_05035 [Microbacterium sp. RD1]|uniref:hypothetical protein n=1 Tax=Microbacterium sp. RD1 TaxID=3457313 RepID=UPI003FA56A86
MSTITGSWSLHMKTPVGTIHADYLFVDADGVVTGSASDGSRITPLTDIVVQPGADGERVTWRQSITKPLRLNLEFDVTVDGDALIGESRAGRLPRTRVTGERIDS